MRDNKLLSGWLCFNKPEGISSNSAMIKVRRIFGEKCGYIGTLDPFATGVLPIAIGECRKFIPYAEETRKTYKFTVIFGKTTDTLDKFGKITEEKTSNLTKSALENVIPFFSGDIIQIPPVYSAIKISGKRACDLAREGKIPEIAPRNVKIFSLRLDEFFSPEKASFTAECSKGTYIRCLARDIAEKTGNIAYVERLERTQAGFFSIKNAYTLENLEKMRDTAELVTSLIKTESPLDDIPALNMTDEQVAKLQNGLKVQVNSPKENAEISRAVSSNILIFKASSREFKGIGFLSADGEVKAVRMCSY